MDPRRPPPTDRRRTDDGPATDPRSPTAHRHAPHNHPSTPPPRQLNSYAKKCEQEEKAHQRKAKDALDAGQNEIARTYASNAIRKKNEAVQYIKSASELDAIIARLNQQNTLTQVNASTVSITKNINKLLKKVPTGKMSANMVDFKDAMGELDHATKTVERSMGRQAQGMGDKDSVDELLERLKDDNAMNFRERGTGVAVSNVNPVPANAEEEREEATGDFMAELNQLRAPRRA